MKTPKSAPVAPIKTSRSRRSFLKVLWGGLGFVATAEFIWIGVSFFKPRKPLDKTHFDAVVAGMVTDFIPGSVTPNQAGGFFLSRLESGSFLAISSRCTHLGCAVTWNPTSARFECPCHSSAFNNKGEVLRPPAPRPLDYFRVTIKNGQVSVHTGEQIKRNRFQSTQVTNL